MLIYRAYEQLTLIYDNVSATSKKQLSRSGHQIFDVFSYIANCFWKVVHVVNMHSNVETIHAACRLKKNAASPCRIKGSRALLFRRSHPWIFTLLRNLAYGPGST